MSKTSNYDILKAVTTAFLEHQDTRVILQKAATQICQRLNFEACTIYVWDAAMQTLVLTAANGYRGGIGTQLRPGQGITGTVFSSRQMLNITNPEKHPAYIFVSETGEEEYHSYLGVPMLSGETCVGVMSIQSRKNRPFHDDVVDLAMTLSNQLAIILSNAQAGKVFRLLEEKSSQPKTRHARHDIELRGAPVAPGAVHGKALVLDGETSWNKITGEEKTEDIPHELRRLESALGKAREETLEIQERAAKVFIEADASIFFAQLLMLEDDGLIEDLRTSIEHGLKAESALKSVIEKFRGRFLTSHEGQLRDRAVDLLDIGMRVLSQLEGGRRRRGLEEHKFILVSREVMPSDLVRLPTHNLLALICSEGGATSHAAILARSLGIPAIMGFGRDHHIEEGDSLIVDGDEGVIYLRPSEQRLTIYRERLHSRRAELGHPLLKEPTVTADGTRLYLQGNVCMLGDFKHLDRINNDGVGLYRSEFMFMIHENFPSENEQYRIYRSLAKLADPNPVVIRALDIGGDKPLKYFDLGKEIDPMLGFRSIRVLLDHPEIFLPHLRAMLRAAQRGNIRILFPMIAHVEDMIAVRAVIDRCLRDLRETYGEKFDMPQIGAMIEMPSAVAQIDAILDYVDFVSLGTNDLVQYTFAVDRGNGRVDRYFKPMHPVILGYLDKVSRACVKRKKGVGVCGEIAGNAQWLPVLAGLGLHHLSMPPPVMPKVKMMAHRIDMDECRKLAQRCLKCRTESEVRQQIERFHEKMNNIEK